MGSYTGLNLTWVLRLVPETTPMGIINSLGQLQLLGNFVQQQGFFTCKVILDQESNFGAEPLHVGEEFCGLAFQLLIYSLQCHIIIEI